MREISIQWKVRTILLVYCLIISNIFIFCIVRFQKDLKSLDVNSYMEDTKFDIQMIFPDSIADQPTNGAYTRDTVKKEMAIYKNLSDYKAYYNNRILKMLIPLIILFCSFLIVSTYLLWIIIKRVQKLDTKEIAKKFKDIKDIKELPNIDESLRQAFHSIKQEYHQYMEDYRRLHSYLSHEQKNAVALLRNNLELQRYDKCSKNIDYIAESIDEILTMSDDDVLTALAPVDVLLVCASVVDVYSSIQPNINFTFCDDDAYVIAKERWIYQAVSNLLDNAVKYGEGKPIDVKVDVKHGSVIITIKDHGIGISKEKQEQIFTHQYRINELNNDGYGIGLSLVSHVCDLCNGFVTLESKLHEGTIFYLSFSCANVSK